MNKMLIASVFAVGMAMQARLAPSHAVPAPAPDNTTAFHPAQQKYVSGSLVRSNAKLKAASLELIYSPEFSSAVAVNVLADLHDGLESHNRQLMLSAFDADKMVGFTSFEDQIDSYFEKYDGFQAQYRVFQVSTLGHRGVAWVDFDLVRITRKDIAVPTRSRGLIRFEMERGQKGWKIVEFRPKEFFK